MKFSLAIGSFAFLVLAVSLCEAALVTGRFSLGGYRAKEDFSDTSVGSQTNDAQTLSARLYLRIQNLGPIDTTIDLRDKNDFFDKLDAERMSLTSSNEFQVREANVRLPNEEGKLFATLGRFSLLEAGSAFVDGTEVGSRLGSEFRVAAFGGHNPKRPEESFLRSATNDTIIGSYLSYQAKTESWDKILNASLAYVDMKIEGDPFRQYLFLNTLTQWNFSSRVISNIYLDFLPRTNVQNGSLVYQQGITQSFDTSLQLLAFDTIEYSRRRGVLEVLPSSPYKEVSLTNRLKFLESAQWLTEGRYGERAVDKRRREEVSTGFYFAELFSPNIDLAVSGGYLKEFTVEGPKTHAEMNYFSPKWELGLDVESAIQNRIESEAVAGVNQPDQLHPLVIEASIANIFSKSLFTTLSFQYAHNEMVTIYSGFFKLTYRFGTEDLPPLRDGSAPKGDL